MFSVINAVFAISLFLDQNRYVLVKDLVFNGFIDPEDTSAMKAVLRGSERYMCNLQLSGVENLEGMVEIRVYLDNNFVSSWGVFAAKGRINCSLSLNEFLKSYKTIPSVLKLELVPRGKNMVTRKVTFDSVYVEMKEVTLKSGTRVIK